MMRKVGEGSREICCIKFYKIISDGVDGKIWKFVIIRQFNNSLDWSNLRERDAIFFFFF